MNATSYVIALNPGEKCFNKKKKNNFKKSLLLKLISFFFFFVSFAPTSLFAQIGFSYSYFNLTRNNGGGTLEPGDIIEVHALGFVNTGTTIKRFYFIDSIRSGTQYIPNSLKIITNEGVPLLIFTDASNDDAGVYDAAVPGVRINIGTSTPGGKAFSGASFYSTSGGGVVTGGDVPIAGPGTLGIIAYQLRITASMGDTIRIGGNFYYRKSGTDYKYHFENTKIKVVQNQGFCPNFSSASFTAESSFGSGNTQNRPQGVAAPGYTKVNITPNKPNDNFYAVVNNSSGDGTTDNTVGYKPNPHRVFGAWDIVGDHTNAASPTIGNLPVSPGTNGGYMLLVNADYNTGLCYIDTIKNVCPNTYYEFSVWIRNLCGQCGSDYTGTPYGPDPGPGFNDKYHGVMPNLTYTVNNVDYYTSGNIHYNGAWQKRGFIYKTGPTETSFVIGIKNNSSGGDGNDWVLDDINLSTCYPNLIMNPNDTAAVCAGFPTTISDTVKSYYNNYGNYQWEASADGNSWFPVKIVGGNIVPGSDPKTATPVLVNGLYQYHADAMIIPKASDSGYYFRLKVATTISNLSNINCSVDNSQKVFLKVYSSSCKVLNAKILNFNGSVINSKNVLQWIMKDDEDISNYVIEKSVDGVHFEQAGSVPPQDNRFGDGYIFTDHENTSNINYYRLKVIGENNSPAIYSKTILLYNRSASLKISTINPFRDVLKVNIFLPAMSKVEMNLCDMYGKILSKKTLQLGAGNSQVTFDDLSNLPVGMYILNVLQNGNFVQKKLIKENY
jgi:hypothetical protein